MSNCCPNLGETVTAFKKPNRDVNVVFLHCSAASRETVDAEEVNGWHLDQGWSCIGYHFFITTDGTIQYGRDLEQTPAAQSGYNTGSIAICMNGLEPTDFTEAQIKSLQWLCQEIDAAYGGIRFRGHKEVSSKSCPVYDYQQLLGLDASGHMMFEVGDLGTGGEFELPEISDIPMISLTATLAQIGLGDEHPHVRWLQRLLTDYGYDPGPADGIFGQGTDKALKDFQLANGLDDDGVCGKKTWERIIDVGDD